MHIVIKLYASFCIGRFKTGERNYPESATISVVAEDLGIHLEDSIILRNGVHAAADDLLQEGDAISFLPLLDGG